MKFSFYGLAKVSARGRGWLLATFFGISCVAAHAHGLGKLIRDVDALQHRCMVASQESYDLQTLDEIFPVVIWETPGRNFGSQQLFRPLRTIGQPLAALGTNCLGGDVRSCGLFSNWVEKLARNDSLRFDRDKHRISSVSMVTGTLSGNLVLRPIALYSGLLLDWGLISFKNESAVFEWMKRRVHDYEHAPRVDRTRQAQNLVLNSAVTQLTVGIATSDKGLAARGGEVYKTYIDTMRVDGSFPQETRRGVSALKYSNMAIAELVLTAELGSTIGMDLYGYRGVNGGIDEAISFLLAAIEDEHLIKRYAAENFAPTDRGQFDEGQAMGFLRDGLGWVVPYAVRFPGSNNALKIREIVNKRRLPVSVYFDENVGAYGWCIWGSGRIAPLWGGK